MNKYCEIDSSLRNYKALLKKLIPLKYKEVLREALGENYRKGNYVRIYPSQGSDIYDKFFNGPRPYNRFL